MERVKLCSSRKGNAKPLGRQKKKVQFFDKTGATHLQESHWET
jgi:hypothetical protein